MKRYIAWLFRAWPVLAIACLALVHMALLNAFTSHGTLVNKLAGTSLQIAGGLIVLHAVNQNLGLFRQQSINAVVLAWIRDFPAKKRANHVLLAGEASFSLSGSAKLTVGRTATTIEERLAEAERQIVEVQALVHAKAAELNQLVASTKTELNTAISTNESRLKLLKETIEGATVGGFKEQAFGVLLAIYGALVGVYA